MIPFIILGTLFLLACVFMLLRGALHGNRRQRAEQVQTNIEIARERLAVITAAHADGEIGDDDFQTEQVLIEQQLAAELDAAGVDGKTLFGEGGQWLNFAAMPIFIAGVAALYVHLGDTRALDEGFIASMTPPGQQPTPVADTTGAGNSSDGVVGDDGKLPSVEELLPRLEAHLQSEPGDARGWTLLGTSYMRLRRFKDAESALGKASELRPDDTHIMLQLADAKAMLADGQIGGEPLAIIQTVLQREPENVQANWLNGMAAQQRGDSKTAVAAWEKLLPQLDGDPQSKQQLQQMIAEARALGNLPDDETQGNESASASTTAESAAATSEQAPGGIEVSVSILPELLEAVSPDTPVFIYAKATEGPPMPLAVIRKRVADLPLTVRLDDSLAMMPAFKLSAFSNVTVGARVSITGDPIAQPGDPFGEQVGVDIGPTESPTIAVEIADRVK